MALPRVENYSADYLASPAKLCIKDNLNLNDLQKLFGSLNWLHLIVSLSTELLHLFDLRKGNPDLNSSQQCHNLLMQAGVVMVR